MVEYKVLYKIMCEMTTVFESSTTPQELILGLKQVFKSFSSLNELNIYLFDKTLNSFKNFAKPWEFLSNDNATLELEEKFKELLSGKEYIKTEKSLFFPLFAQGKLSGIIKADVSFYDDLVEQILPLLSRQISLAVLHLTYFESAKNNAKFYEAIKNIMKITETQYDLSYVLPIMGEIIDGFIREHLIYIFMKKSKTYKLIWPNKCLVPNIKEYFQEIKTTPIIKENGKTCVFPLIEGKKPFGAIVAYNPVEPLSEGEIKYLEQLSVQASVTVTKAKEYMKVLENATLDALTGLNNRHMFYQRLDEATSNAKRQKTPLCCIMTDIDFFKSVNDKYGHAVGDLVLKTAAKTIKKELRQYDIASRYGGEEFAILLPNTPLEEAYKVAQRLRKQIEKKKINISEYKIDGVEEISITISLGVALYDDNTMQDSSLLYRAADKGLYIAKESGRNRVVIP